MSINSIDALVAAEARAQRLMWQKDSFTTVANKPFSLFGVSGYPPAGAAQGSLNGANPDFSTTGALPMRNPASGNTLYSGSIEGIGGANPGLLYFYDRVWHNSAVVCDVTSTQSITQPGLSRYTDGVGLEIWAEAWTAWGATGTTFTVTYTNTDGVASRVATYVWPAGAPTVGQCFRFPLQSGDIGVSSIQSIALTPSTGTAGNLGLFLAKPIMAIGFSATTPFSRSPIATNLTPIANSACLAAILFPNTTTSGAPAIDWKLPEG